MAKVNGKSLNFLVEESFKAFVVLFSFSNLSMINLNTNGGPSSDALIVVFMAISILCVLSPTDVKRSIIAPSLLISVSLLLDPDYYPIIISGVGLALISDGIVQRRVTRSIGYLGRIFLLTLPTLVFITYSLSVTVPFLGNGSSRSFISFVDTLRGRSVNLSLSNVIVLLGHGWSTITYGPPSVLGMGGNINSLTGMGYPTQVLIPHGYLTTIWLFCLFLVPLVAFAAGFFRNNRFSAIPVISVSILAILFTQYPNYQLLLLMAYKLTQTPIIGGALLLPLIAPGHAIQLLASTYMILVPMCMYEMWLIMNNRSSHLIPYFRTNNNSSCRFDNSLQTKILLGFIKTKSVKLSFGSLHRSKKPFAAFLTIVLAVMLLFPGWQSLNGNFYPSRAYPPYNGGNNVPNSAPFNPVKIPPNEVKAYEYLANQPGDFTIYWPNNGMPPGTLGQAISVFSANDPPKPLASIPAFAYLLYNRLYGDIAPYLQSQSVKYVVVQDFPPELMLSAYGYSEISSVVSNLNNCPDLSISAIFNGLYIYELNLPVNTIHNVSLVLRANNQNFNSVYGYAVFNSMGIQAAFSPQMNPSFSFDANTTVAKVDLLAPSFLALNSSYSPLHAVSSSQTLYPYLSDAADKVVNYVLISRANISSGFVNSSDSLRFDSSWMQGSGSINIGNWTDTNWGSSPVYVSLNGSVLTWQFINSTFVTFGYNGSLSESGVPGGITIQNPSSQLVVANVSFLYRNSANYTGDMSVNFVADNSSAYNIASPGQQFKTSQTWKQAYFKAILPIGTKYFTIRLGAGSSAGWAQTKDVNISWSALDINSSLPYGNDMKLTNAIIHLNEFRGMGYFECMGDGSINGVAISAKQQYEWVPSTVSGNVYLVGNLTIAAIVIVAMGSITSLESNSVVYSMPYLQSYVLRSNNQVLHPLITETGTNVFINVSHWSGSVILEPEMLIEFGYSAILLYLASLAFLLLIGIKRVERRWKLK
ncbi:MAG: hypothetical protein JRN15_14135 [Nitrososphaerota archaeon]|nr:hypothetical protein [Nitrososphaerota archaeon]